MRTAPHQATWREGGQIQCTQLIPQLNSPVFKWPLQVTIFIESTLRDIFVNKMGAVTYFSLFKKSCFLKLVLLVNFQDG